MDKTNSYLVILAAAVGIAGAIEAALRGWRVEAVHWSLFAVGMACLWPYFPSRIAIWAKAIGWTALAGVATLVFFF